MSQRFVRIAAFALIVAASPAPAAAENFTRWASVGGALTFDPHAYDDVPTNGQVRPLSSLILR